MVKYTLNKKERLKSKKAIENLFREGKKYKKYPIRLIFEEIQSTGSGDSECNAVKHTQVGFSVPKKLHNKAVVRNKIKRQMKEAYRINKAFAPSSYYLFFIYYAKDKMKFEPIENAIKQLLLKLEE